MANQKLIGAFHQAIAEGILDVRISSLAARTGIPAQDIDKAETWGVKSWTHLQNEFNIFRKGKGKTVKFYEFHSNGYVKSETGILTTESHVSENIQVIDSSATTVITAQTDLAIDKELDSQKVAKLESLLNDLEESEGFIPLSVGTSYVPTHSEDDELDEENSEDFVSNDVHQTKPHWEEIFGELNKRNPIYARVAAVASCYYHASIDFREYFYLISLIHEIYQEIDAKGDKYQKLIKELSNWEPSPSFGVLLMGILGFNAPRYLLKNPNAKFQDGGYVFLNGERPSKLPMFVATGKTGTGKSEIIKLLSMVADGTYSVSTTSASVMQKISEIKDKRKGSDDYSLGWRGLPSEHYDLSTQTYANPICLIPDLSRRGVDFPKLEEALKSACEQDKNIERQSGSLDSSNKSWLLNGANIAISSCYELSDDPNHPISELIRRSIVIGCHGINGDEGEKIKDKLLKPNDIDWNGFSLSYLWQKEFTKLSSGNQVNKLVAIKDGKTKQMVYPIQNAEQEVRQWEISEGLRSGSLDFTASVLAFGLVCWVRRNKFISREFLISSLKHYLNNTKQVLSNQSTSTEFTEQFTEILNNAVAKLSKAKGVENVAISDGITATLIQKHYTNTAKRLLASKKDIPSLTELMSSLGYEARIKDENGKLYEDGNGEIETRYFLKPQEDI